MIDDTEFSECILQIDTREKSQSRIDETKPFYSGELAYLNENKSEFKEVDRKIIKTSKSSNDINKSEVKYDTTKIYTSNTRNEHYLLTAPPGIAKETEPIKTSGAESPQLLSSQVSTGKADESEAGGKGMPYNGQMYSQTSDERELANKPHCSRSATCDDNLKSPSEDSFPILQSQSFGDDSLGVTNDSEALKSSSAECVQKRPAGATEKDLLATKKKLSTHDILPSSAALSEFDTAVTSERKTILTPPLVTPTSLGDKSQEDVAETTPSEPPAPPIPEKFKPEVIKSLGDAVMFSFAGVKAQPEMEVL